jgi:hypothetical protein
MTPLPMTRIRAAAYILRHTEAGRDAVSEHAVRRAMSPSSRKL